MLRPTYCSESTRLSLFTLYSLFSNRESLDLRTREAVATSCNFLNSKTYQTHQKMSIVPISNNDNGGRVSLVDPFSDLWDPFLDFPFPSTFSRIFPEFNLGTSVNSRLDWRETPTAHVLKAALPGFGNEDVLVQLQDERVLQISTDSGNFMSRFKLPDNAMVEQLKASMNNGVLTVTVPKVEARRPSVRVVEISGDD